MQSAANWIEEGIEIGFKRGFDEGIRQGTIDLIIRQLSSKFGQLESTIKRQISGLQTALLEVLGVELLSFENLEDLTIWLEKIQEAMMEEKSDRNK